jgi:hypothetical protein
MNGTKPELHFTHSKSASSPKRPDFLMIDSEKRHRVALIFKSRKFASDFRSMICDTDSAIDSNGPRISGLQKASSRCLREFELQRAASNAR